MEKERADLTKVAHEGMRALYGLEAYLRHTGLEPSLLNLIKLRASQINGCGYCMDMHTRDARLAGETEQRLYVLSAWREAPFYTDRERAALAWTEAVTRTSPESTNEELYRSVREQFSEVVDLTLAVVSINTWSRLAISFRAEPGTYQPEAARKAG